MLKTLFPALLFLCIGPGFAATPLQQDLETSAKEAIAAKRFQKARELYRTLSETNPQNMDYVVWVGRLSGWLHDYEAAIAAFDKALARNPRDSDALIAKAYILMYQQRHRASEELLNKAREITPASLDLGLAFARNYHYQRQDDKAQKELSQVLALDPDNSEARALKKDITPRRFEMVMGYGQDRLSVASPAHVGAVSLGYIGTRNRATAQYEVWNKFGDVAHRSGFNVAHRFGRPLWIRGGMLLAPSARAVARQDYTGGFAYALAERVVLSTDYRHMRFNDVVVHVVIPSIEYYFETPRWLQASFYQAWTDYAAPGLPIAGTQSFSIRYNQQLNEAVLLHAGYARGNESFSALSVDRLGKFGANTFTTGANFKVSPSYVTGVFYSYQKRLTGSQQSSFGVSLTVRK